ncbi:uncharacterized protein LOC106644934 [Copidosoma floridanum]|uniref:uncharacterized protein LOC106644934 n=1 Tax=Copidosoma floridanum TaxID=29053 RepID=UPI0006C9DA75|nr:uncharacterized protein LOC106644934 [Copidosoma floridanum]
MEHFTLELRPRLRSHCAFLTFEKNIDSTAIKIKLQKASIEIETEEKNYSLSLPDIKLWPFYLGSLQVTGRWIYFRIITPSNLCIELFKTTTVDLDDQLSKSTIIDPHVANLPSKNEDCKLICTCCKNQITKTVSFNRILSLPSSDCDPQEWYCCNHGHNNEISLEPKKSDLFYSFNRCVFNQRIFENLKIKNSLIHCNKCLSIIGSCRKKKESLQFWNCCIEYDILRKEPKIEKSNSCLSDFLSAVKCTTNMTFGEQILLEARDVNSVHYLFIEIFSPKLRIITEDKANFQQQILSLKSLFVVKVSYKYGENPKRKINYDLNTNYCEVAVPSILAGISELVSSSARFPPAYRKMGDSYMGYLLF